MNYGNYLSKGLSKSSVEESTSIREGEHEHYNSPAFDLQAFQRLTENGNFKVLP